MRKRLSALSLVAALLLVPTTDVLAQTSTQPTQQETDEGDDSGKWGLLGLLGLGGLAGLLRRQTPDRGNIGSRSIRDPEPPRPSGH